MPGQIGYSARVDHRQQEVQGRQEKARHHLPSGWLWSWWRVVLGVADHVQDQGDRNRARPRGEKDGDGRLCRDPPDPTIVTNFLIMAETTVCKATLPSESGSEALLVSTSPEHREMHVQPVPVGSPRKSAGNHSLR